MECSPAWRLKETRFDNERLNALGIEPMTLAELRSRVAAGQLAEPERVDFYLLLLVTAGQGTHSVDFVDWPLAPGSLVFVRPGQVQQWHAGADVDGQMVLLTAATLPYRDGQSLSRELELLALDTWPACAELPAGLAAELGDGLQRLRRDFDRFDASALDVSLIRQQMLTLLLRLAKWHSGRPNAETPSRGRSTYRLFLRELESAFHAEHSLRHYAQRLGYAQSTLSRACLRAEGRSAKQVIDRRIALEAQRMLAHGSASIAEIGHQLGFSEATNFVKFFRRVIGVTPALFRQQLRAGLAHSAVDHRAGG